MGEYSRRGFFILFADLMTDETMVPNLESSWNAGQEARAESDFMARITENVRLPAVMLDARGRILFANRFLLRLTGWSLEEVIGKDWIATFAAPEQARQVNQVFEFVVQVRPELYCESEIIARSGKRLLIAWNNTVLKDGAGEIIGIASIGENITENKRKEERLNQISKEQQTILDTSPIGIALTIGRRIQWSNPAHKAMFVYASKDMGGLDTSAFYIHPGDYERVGRESIEHIAQGLSYMTEVEQKRSDGAHFWCLLQGRAIDPTDLSTGVIWMVMDVTERKRLEEQFRQAQKMEAVGQLAGGIAHDFNNILAAALLHLGLLQQNPGLTMGMKESLKEVESMTVRAARLTRQLLLFGQAQAARVEPLNVNELILGLLKMLRRLLCENIKVEFRSSSTPAWVNADAGMIEQVVVNLCINSRDAMPNGGSLTLATTLVEFDDHAALRHPYARPGSFVCLSVTDTGCGMDETVLKRIFEPFFTTKEVGKGTGLGLASVYGIVKQHQGWVEVSSQVGQGSAFRVYLAAEAGPLRAPAPPGAAEQIRGGSEMILMVEDELPLRSMAALCLRRLGYVVLEASHGLEALKAWEEHHQSIALLFTDMVMPEAITGLELAMRFKQEKASLEVIISSGYSADLAQSLASAGQNFTCLPKPYMLGALAKLVRHCLDNAR